MTEQGLTIDRPEAADAYLELCRRFPLRPLRTEEELDRATGIINGLLDRKSLSIEEEDYLDVLSDLVERYESKHHPIPDASEAEMLEFLIESNDRTQAEVAAGAGVAESTLSEILAGKRRMNRAHIEALSRYFRISPAVFLPEIP